LNRVEFRIGFSSQRVQLPDSAFSPGKANKAAAKKQNTKNPTTILHMPSPILFFHFFDNKPKGLFNPARISFHFVVISSCFSFRYKVLKGRLIHAFFWESRLSLSIQIPRIFFHEGDKKSESSDQKNDFS